MNSNYLHRMYNRHKELLLVGVISDSWGSCFPTVCSKRVVFKKGNIIEMNNLCTSIRVKYTSIV